MNTVKSSGAKPKDPFGIFSITSKPSQDKFRPELLPDNELNQLHETARRQGKTELVKIIEDEVFRREKRKVEARDSLVK